MDLPALLSWNLRAILIQERVATLEFLSVDLSTFDKYNEFLECIRASGITGVYDGSCFILDASIDHDTGVVRVRTQL
jgi:hypothetical protein